MRRARARAAARLPAAVACLVWVPVALLACAPEPAPTVSRPDAAPVGAAAYRARLAREAGVDLAPEELARLAAGDADWIEARMDEVARRIEPDAAGWRPVFQRLRRDHPADGEAVLALYRAEVERARRFVEARELVTLPAGPLEVVATPESLPAGRYPLSGYLGYRVAVTLGGGDRLADHCRVCIPPLAVHEAYPGHHTAFLHQRSGSPVLETAALELAGENLRNHFFHEGWAQYAEVLMLEEGYYDGEPERELGAWRNLLFRVTRARLDPLLHTGVLTAEEAVAALSPFLTRTTAEAEVARHLADPTMKAGYYVGLLQVLGLRETVRRSDPTFDLRAFHDRLVRLPLPLPDAARLRFGVEEPSALRPLSDHLP